MGPWMGGSPCRMSNLRNGNVACDVTIDLPPHVVSILKGNLKAIPVRVLTSNLLGSVLDHVET